jgi:hypothetical protein
LRQVFEALRMAGMDAAVLSGMSKLKNAPAFRVMPYPLEPDFVPDDGLQDALEAATAEGAASPDLNPHGFAIVDLSDDIAHPRYAGYQDTKQALIGSLAKLLPLYGAFELRHNLRGALMDFGISDLDALAQVTRANLASVHGASGTRPLIEKLFKISAGGLDFVFSGPPRHNDQFLSQEVHDKISIRIARTTRPNPKPPPAKPISRLDDDTVLAYELTDFQEAVPAEDQLRLMAGWSDNVSAAVIIQALGFEYLWALTTRSGLYRKSWKPLTRNDHEAAGPGGLLVTRPDYNYGGWRKLPAGVPGGQAGTARSIAVLMTMLALDALVDSQSGIAMREMMRKQGLQFGPGLRWENSPIGRGMEMAGWDANQPAWAYDGSITLAANHDLAVSKIGVTVPPHESRSNALIVRTKRNVKGGGQKLITAVLVSLNWTSGDANVGEQFGKRMAMALETKHNLVPGA